MRRRDKLDVIVRSSTVLGLKLSFVQQIRRSTLSRTAVDAIRSLRWRTDRPDIHSGAGCVAGI